jgi:GGDEF domain-containing protein
LVVRREAGEPAAALRARLQARLRELDRAPAPRGVLLDGARALWQYVDRATGPGSLLLVVLESWLRVADTYGIAASDAYLYTFLGRCAPAASVATVRAWVGQTSFAAYWDGSDAGEPERASEDLLGELAATAVTYRGKDVALITTAANVSAARSNASSPSGTLRRKNAITASRCAR